MAALKLIKTVKNAKLYQDGDDGPKLILLEKVRISFPAIGHMKEDEGDDGNKTKKYKGVAMLPKKTHMEAKALFMEIVAELKKVNDAKIPNEYLCIKNGDDSERDEYQEHYVVSASESRRPVARDQKGKLYLDPKNVKDGADTEAALNEIDEIFHGGVIVNILLRPWYFNGKAKGKTKTYPKRICAGLMAIQFHEDDGTSYGSGRIDDSGVFGGSDNDDDDDDGMDDDDDDL